MTYDLLTESRALAHLSETLNNRQHAGLKITPTMWSALYDQTNRVKAAIDDATPAGDDWLNDFNYVGSRHHY